MTEAAKLSKKERFKKWMKFPLIVALLGLTIGALTPDVRDYIANTEALKWSEVPATISALQFDISVRLKDPYFKPLVQYRYKVDGREYTGERTSHTSPLLGYDMNIWAADHAVGKAVTVRVDQLHPEKSLLEPAPDLVQLLSRVLAMLMFTSLIYISTYPFVPKKQRTANPDATAGSAAA